MKILKSVAVYIALVFMSLSANAALIDRGSGFIYDDIQDITWTQDADINGLDTWTNQVFWADSLSLFDSVRNVTWDDWRLPTTTQPDASCSSQLDPGGGFPLQGNNLGCTGSEMGYLFNVDGISSSSTGLFTNVQPGYWSGTETEWNSVGAWFFNFGTGRQSAGTKLNNFSAWAVRDGDVVPIPAAAWLFGTALALLGWIRRRKA